jgi:AraC-like DNA-binding protein
MITPKHHTMQTLFPKSHYAEWQPSPAVSPYVESFGYASYEVADPSVADINHCHPRGTVEIITHLEGSPIDCLIDGEWMAMPNTFLSGLSLGSTAWKPTGSGNLLVIRLKPHAAEKLFGMPLIRFTRQVVPIQQLYNSRFYAVLRQLKGFTQNEDRIRLLEHFLMHELGSLRPARDPFAAAMQIIWQREGNLSLTELSETAGLGHRQLQRIFKDRIGLSPKMYGRVVRFNHALQAARRSPYAHWNQLARHYGYSDQSHFIRECKAISGLTPVAFVQNGWSIPIMLQ